VEARFQDTAEARSGTLLGATSSALSGIANIVTNVAAQRSTGNSSRYLSSTGADLIVRSAPSTLADEIPRRAQSEPDVEAQSDALLREVARVCDVLMPVYQSIGPAGGLVLAMMRTDLDRAAEAMIEGDVAGMLAAHELLSAYKE
jgi:hypothetical protein